MWPLEDRIPPFVDHQSIQIGQPMNYTGIPNQIHQRVPESVIGRFTDLTCQRSDHVQFNLNHPTLIKKPQNRMWVSVPKIP
jgi:hypothetical protein